MSNGFFKKLIFLIIPALIIGCSEGGISSVMEPLAITENGLSIEKGSFYDESLRYGTKPFGQELPCTISLDEAVVGKEITHWGFKGTIETVRDEVYHNGKHIKVIKVTRESDKELNQIFLQKAVDDVPQWSTYYYKNDHEYLEYELYPMRMRYELAKSLPKKPLYAHVVTKSEIQNMGYENELDFFASYWIDLVGMPDKVKAISHRKEGDRADRDLPLEMIYVDIGTVDEGYEELFFCIYEELVIPEIKDGEPVAPIGVAKTLAFAKDRRSLEEHLKGLCYDFLLPQDFATNPDQWDVWDATK